MELGGQITKPLPVKSEGKHGMLGIKLLTQSASFFFREEVGAFNNQVTNLLDVVGDSVKLLDKFYYWNNDDSKNLNYDQRTLRNTFKC